MKINERIHWQAVRGIAMIAVVFIHSLSGYSWNEVLEYTGVIFVRQAVNFAVAIFVFMAGYFIKSE